MYMYIIKT